MPGDFVELALQTIATEGEDATLARLIAKLDEAPLPVRRDYMFLLTLVPCEAALAWLEARIESPVVGVWGRTAAWLGIDWPRIAAWMSRGRPHSLAALDALDAYAKPGPGSSGLARAMEPVLPSAPSVEELNAALAALKAVDDSPRVMKSVEEITGLAREILRPGPSPGISARAFFERLLAKERAEKERWNRRRRRDH